MADKHTYTVNRAMHGDGRDYDRGDTRQLSEADAAPLIATGALSLKGEGPIEREPAVRHTFGTDAGAAPDHYTTATVEGVVQGQPAVLTGGARKAAKAK